MMKNDFTGPEWLMPIGMVVLVALLLAAWGGAL